MNLVTQYIRRISKYFTNATDVPTVAQAGTNHIDDADSWTNNTIYKGETVVNLATGKQYSSDGIEIIELNYENSIMWGMQVVSIPGASVDADPLYFRVTDGYVRIQGRQYRHNAVHASVNAPGDAQVRANTGIYGRYDYVYATSGYPNKVSSSDAYYKAQIVVVTGYSESQRDSIYIDDAINYQLTQAGITKDNSVLLGVIYVPPLYFASGGVNHLRPWSWGVSGDGSGENKLNFIEGQHMFAASLTPAALLDKVVSRLTIHRENGNLRNRYTYLENQLLVYDNGLDGAPDKKLYKVVETHFCESLYTSITEGKIVVIAGEGVGSPGSGGTYDHSELTALAYDASGHTGFQRLTYTLDRDPDYNDCSLPPSGSVKAEAGVFWVNIETEQVFVCLDATPGAAEWKNAISDVRNTEDDKAIACSRTEDDGDPALANGITNTPANDTYVKVEINGMGVIVGNGTKEDCDLYFSDDDGVTAKPMGEIVAGDVPYWVGSFAGYELDTDDELSMHYLVAAVGAGLGGIVGPIWGGDTLTP